MGDLETWVDAMNGAMLALHRVKERTACHPTFAEDMATLERNLLRLSTMPPSRAPAAPGVVEALRRVLSEFDPGDRLLGMQNPRAIRAIHSARAALASLQGNPPSTGQEGEAQAEPSPSLLPPSEALEGEAGTWPCRNSGRCSHWMCKPPESPKVSPQGSPPEVASAPKALAKLYRLLLPDEVIPPDAESLMDDCQTWRPCEKWIVGRKWGNHFVPMRTDAHPDQSFRTKVEAPTPGEVASGPGREEP